MVFHFLVRGALFGFDLVEIVMDCLIHKPAVICWHGQLIRQVIWVGSLSLHARSEETVVQRINCLVEIQFIFMLTLLCDESKSIVLPSIIFDPSLLSLRLVRLWNCNVGILFAVKLQDWQAVFFII